MLTIPEVATRLSLSESTIYRLVCARVLPARQIGRSWRIDAGELKEYLDHASTVGASSLAGSTDSALGSDSSVDEPHAAHVRAPEPLGSRARPSRAGEEQT